MEGTSATADKKGIIEGGNERIFQEDRWRLDHPRRQPLGP